MRNSIKKMLLMATIAMMVVSLVAPAAMADEQAQDHQKDPRSGTGPVVRDHGTGSSSNSSSAVEVDPLKDQGIRQCDLVPSGCQEDTYDNTVGEHGHNSVVDPDTDDPSSAGEKPLKDQRIRQCDLVPPGCQDAEDSQDDHDHDSGGAHPDTDDPSPDDEEPLKDPGIRQCDIAPPGCQGTAVKPVEEVAGGITTTTISQENDASAAPPKVGSAPDEAGQSTDSGPDIHGCPYDYDYDYDLDVCLPSLEDFDFFPILSGDKPWPDTAGGYVTLPGEAAGDLLLGLGASISGFGGIVENALNWYGEDGGPIGSVFQGLGQTIGFATDVSGTIVSGAGEVVSGASDVVGEAVDAVGDAAGDAWDEVSSWW